MKRGKLLGMRREQSERGGASSSYLHIPADCVRAGVCVSVCEGRGRQGMLIVVCMLIG